MIDPDGYRPNVGIVLTREGGDVFWARRINRDGWQFPQGGMRSDETPPLPGAPEASETLDLGPLADPDAAALARELTRTRSGTTAENGSRSKGSLDFRRHALAPDRALTASRGQRARGLASSGSVNPRAKRSAPAHAIIAPLSVQRACGGRTMRTPTSCPRRCRPRRTTMFEATPPAATKAVGFPTTTLNLRKPTRVRSMTTSTTAA